MPRVRLRYHYALHRVTWPEVSSQSHEEQLVNLLNHPSNWLRWFQSFLISESSI